jgi:hypothetical protein
MSRIPKVRETARCPQAGREYAAHPNTTMNSRRLIGFPSARYDIVAFAAGQMEQAN